MKRNNKVKYLLTGDGREGTIWGLREGRKERVKERERKWPERTRGRRRDEGEGRKVKYVMEKRRGGAGEGRKERNVSRKILEEKNRKEGKGEDRIKIRIRK